jgi:hypothetical protein
MDFYQGILKMREHHQHQRLYHRKSHQDTDPTKNNFLLLNVELISFNELNNNKRENSLCRNP